MGNYLKGKTGVTAGSPYLVGFRLVRPEGIILWQRQREQDDKLLKYIGQNVYIEDTLNGTIHIYEVQGHFLFKGYKETPLFNRPICNIWKETK